VGEEEGEKEGSEDRDALPPGPRCMDPTKVGDPEHFFDANETNSAYSARE
jgi:hypothetical protein